LFAAGIALHLVPPYAWCNNGTASVLVSGELQAVLPLDDAAPLDTAGPKVKGGAVGIDQAAKVARQDAIVQTLVKAGPVSVAILGGDHDLTDRWKRQAARANTCA
jgi:hypothetical protein